MLTNGCDSLVLALLEMELLWGDNSGTDLYTF